MYTIGVSSGMFKIPSQDKEKEEIINIMKKIFWGATKGVNFTQIDIESIAEFNEPFLQENIRKIRELGLKFGIHSETAATTGIHTMPLDSALAEDYIRAHDRLIKHLEGAEKIGAEYVLTHASESTPIILIASKAQPKRLVDFYGRPLSEFLEQHPEILDWTIKKHNLSEIFMKAYHMRRFEEFVERELNEWKRQNPDKELSKDVEESIKKSVENTFKQELLNFVNSNDLTESVEKLAYYIIAKYMEMKKDELWVNIVGNKKIDDIWDNYQEWVPAVAAKYIWGHFNPVEKKYKNPKELLEKAKLYFVFETEMAQGGYETYMRLAKIPHLYYLAKAIKSKYVTIAIDFQHLLSCGFDPIEQIKELPEKGGELVKIIHLSYPTPHVPTHIKIPVGSEAQKYIYDGLYILRKKGFKDGIIIFERGSPESVQESVIAIRLIVDALEKDTPPDELTEEFYGMPKGGPSIKMQEFIIMEHALDPLKGMLAVPEEEHGFFGKAAVDKGKGEIWKKERYR